MAQVVEFEGPILNRAHPPTTREQQPVDLEAPYKKGLTTEKGYKSEKEKIFEKE